MLKPQLEVGDIARHYGKAFLKDFGRLLSVQQRRVLRDLTICRTAALGGHVKRCDHCDHQEIAYNSCRNRHCPKCQSAARLEWVSKRESELLPVPYFHVVFTLPSELGPLALQNKRVLYGLLFRAAAETLQELAADPRHLGAQIGFLAVLHTWGQNLMHHPHLHCILPAGGLSPNRSQWISCRRSKKNGKPFLAPVRVISRVFRGKFVQMLKAAFFRGEISFHGKLVALAKPCQFERFLNGCVKHDWVVYAKPPFGSPHQVLRYLGRYSHRVAISNRRIVDVRDGQVRFRWKDYADDGRQKVMTLDTNEFLRRFLLHTLPQGFQRIRYYGLLASRCRKQNLELCRSYLEPQIANQTEQLTTANDVPVHDDSAETCGKCNVGRMQVIEKIDPPHRHLRRPLFLDKLQNVPRRHLVWDSS